MTKLVNRAKMTTSTTGTGTITLGSAVTGYQTFADAGVSDADVVRYVIEDGSDWEIGTGTYTASGTTLSRTPSESSNADAAINLSGSAVVYVTAAAADIVQPDNNLSDLTNAATARTNLGLAIGTNVQAYDAGLQSIAGLTTAADRMIYTTAADTYAVTTLTSFARGLLDDADAATARTTLGVAIGTNVQAYDADLAAIAGLAVTDGNFIVGNGTTWVAESGATARTSLGLGTAATMTGPTGTIVGTTDTQTLTNKTISADNNTLSGIAASSFVLSNASGNIDGSAAQKEIPSGVVVGTTDTQTLTNKRIDPRVVTSATSGTLTINGNTTDLYSAVGLTGAITFATPSGTPVNGQRLVIRIEDNGTARGITWTTTSGAFRAVGVTLPTTTVATKVTYVGCFYNTTDTFWDVVAVVTQA